MPSCFKPVGFDPVKDALRFHITPRYTTGSPAMVRADTATAIVRRESDAYNAMINGVEGLDRKEQAKQLGLSGIVEERWEFEGRTHFRDLITGEVGYLDSSKQRREVTYGKV